MSTEVETLASAWDAISTEVKTLASAWEAISTEAEQEEYGNSRKTCKHPSIYMVARFLYTESKLLAGPDFETPRAKIDLSPR